VVFTAGVAWALAVRARRRRAAAAAAAAGRTEKAPGAPREAWGEPRVEVEGGAPIRNPLQGARRAGEPPPAPPAGSSLFSLLHARAAAGGAAAVENAGGAEKEEEGGEDAFVWDNPMHAGRRDGVAPAEPSHERGVGGSVLSAAGGGMARFLHTVGAARRAPLSSRPREGAEVDAHASAGAGEGGGGGAFLMFGNPMFAGGTSAAPAAEALGEATALRAPAEGAPRATAAFAPPAENGHHAQPSSGSPTASAPPAAAEAEPLRPPSPAAEAQPPPPAAAEAPPLSAPTAALAAALPAAGDAPHPPSPPPAPTLLLRTAAAAASPRVPMSPVAPRLPGGARSAAPAAVVANPARSFGALLAPPPDGGGAEGGDAALPGAAATFENPLLRAVREGGSHREAIARAARALQRVAPPAAPIWPNE
jgi:hypothetical protein